MPAAAHVDCLAGLIIFCFFRMAGLMTKCIVLDFLSAALQVVRAECLVDRVIIHRVTDRKDSRLYLICNDLIVSGCLQITEIGDKESLAGGCIFLLVSCHAGIDDITGIHIDNRVILKVRILEDRDLLRIFLISESARRNDIEFFLVAVISIDQKNSNVVEMDGMGSCGICTLPVTAVEAEARSLVGLFRHRKFRLKVLLFRSDSDRVDHIGVIILAVDLCAPDERSFDIAAGIK